MIRSFIQMTALTLTLEASIFLLKANLGLIPKTIAKIITPHYGFSKPVAKSLSKQTADTRLGVILLLLAFVLQLVNTLWPMRIKDFNVNWYGIFIAIGLCIIIFIMAHWYSKRLSEKIYKSTLEIVEKENKEKTNNS